MSVYQALLLGIVQGLTEFLPISSSGHLVLGQEVLGVEEPQVLFDVMLHVGTLAAVVLAYRRDLATLARSFVSALASGGLLRRPVETVRASADLELLSLLIVGSIPTALIGLLFQEQLEAAFASPRLVAGMLIVTGSMLHLPRLTAGRPRGAVGWWQAPLIGLIQGLAIIPGISRSGSTISIGMLAGVRPADAARFSFLLSIPAILGAAILKLLETDGPTPPLSVLAAGMAASFLVGYLALRALLAVLRRGRLDLFSYYCFALGLGFLAFLGQG